MVNVLYTVLTVIAVLAILNSYAVAQATIPLIRWLERRNACTLIYFLECDQCKGFWIILLTAYFYGCFPLSLVAYGILIAYLALTNRQD